MSIKLSSPYKIVARKQKRYTDHYQIPANDCVVVPQKIYGEDVSCSVYWKGENGEVRKRFELLFLGNNLEPVDAMKDYQLYEVWQHDHGNTQPAQ